ncbi:MAG: hypothetical protein SAK29_27510 [Scytonema sp. PMC 1069.18]|nr:hypothetical protein [Scytonema sp. PMC 1069.18]MEC4886778.1 hypothetical protein [Scytonema sp. PMC 1070.18]
MSIMNWDLRLGCRERGIECNTAKDSDAEETRYLQDTGFLAFTKDARVAIR